MLTIYTSKASTFMFDFNCIFWKQNIVNAHNEMY